MADPVPMVWEDDPDLKVDKVLREILVNQAQLVALVNLVKLAGRAHQESVDHRDHQD
jgi:hypothetical protein